MKRYLSCLLLFIPLFTIAQKQYPADVEAVLMQTPSNRHELDKALDYFEKQGDSLKIKAIDFLVANMDIHYSASYYWEDSQGKKVPFDELGYADFKTSLVAFDAVKATSPSIHAEPIFYRDIDSMKADMLIDNVEQAFKVWKSPWAQNISFNNFCEYLLPYRISVEPLQNWRIKYMQRLEWIKDSIREKTTGEVISCFASDYNKWFTNTYNIETRKEPLPRLGALQLLFRKKGACEDVADLEVFSLRSQGIPASIDQVPAWATSSGRHFLNVAFSPDMQPVSFDVSTELVSVNKLNREPAKVLRTTFSKQNVLAASEKNENIPPGILRTLNYVDVTKEYWETRDINASLFKISNAPKVAFTCVFNFSKWQPVWWGEVINGKAVFKDMCKGAVFLPMYYINNKLIPAGYPVASGYNNTLVLKPDTLKSRTVQIANEERYLAFQAGKKYTLYYWNNAWKEIGVKTAVSNTRELVFNNVPLNALLLLRPEYSQNKERPFIITQEGQRLWW